VADFHDQEIPMKFLLRTLLCAGLLVLAGQAHAGFFIPKDATMTMGMYSPDAQAFELSHGLSRQLSLTAAYHRYLSDDRSKDRRFTTVQLGYLLNRSYHADGVGNVYVFGGPIAARSSETGGTRAGLQAGLWGDYETRRIYLRASTQIHHASSMRQTVTTGQALWAPYAADYEDVASWMGVQVQRRSNLSHATQITPMLRFFQRNWWVDAGISTNRQHRGDAFINLMILY
jgi:hypothetical protein